MLLCMHILHWVLLTGCRTVMWCRRCCSMLLLKLNTCKSMLLLNLNACKSCALGGVAAASSCYTVCMLYDTYRVPAQSESVLLFMHITLKYCLVFVVLLVPPLLQHAVCGSIYACIRVARRCCCYYYIYVCIAYFYGLRLSLDCRCCCCLLLL